MAETVQTVEMRHVPACMDAVDEGRGSVEQEVLQRRAPIAIVRLDDLSEALAIARALIGGGITVMEFTLTNRDALGAVERVRAELGTAATVGAGTMLDAESARAAIGSGAQFLVSPALEPEVVRAGVEAGVPVVCGALTPTEILAAHRLGAALVKVFPARAFGPAYIKDLLAPLPELRLVPTGGVDLENCADFLRAGAYSVGLGSSLVRERLVAERAWDGLTELARRFAAACTG